VHLVDLKKTPLIEVTERGVRTSTDEFEFDSIVFATGFDAMTGSLTAFDIAGRDGVLLKEKWAAGPRTYLGVATAGFPNFWMITGPGSPSVLSNMMISIEQHVDWIADAMTWARERGVNALDPTPDAEDEWTAHVDEVGHTTLYPSANSWYMGSNVVGKPRVFLPYIGGVGVYREECDAVAAKDYDGFTAT
jgi:cyclohexanone monooxygenase